MCRALRAPWRDPASLVLTAAQNHVDVQVCCAISGGASHPLLAQHLHPASARAKGANTVLHCTLFAAYGLVHVREVHTVRELRVFCALRTVFT